MTDTERIAKMGKAHGEANGYRWRKFGPWRIGGEILAPNGERVCFTWAQYFWDRRDECEAFRVAANRA